MLALISFILSSTIPTSFFYTSAYSYSFFGIGYLVLMGLLQLLCNVQEDIVPLIASRLLLFQPTFIKYMNILQFLLQLDRSIVEYEGIAGHLTTSIGYGSGLVVLVDGCVVRPVLVLIVYLGDGRGVMQLRTWLVSVS